MTDIAALTADVHDLVGAYTEHAKDSDLLRASQALADQLRQPRTQLSRYLQPGTPRRLRTDLQPTARRHAAELLALVERLEAQQAGLWLPPAGRALGLLDQAARLGHVPSTAGSHERVKASKPGSRPPATLAALDLLADAETGTWAHDAALRDALDEHLTLPYDDTTQRPGGDPRPWQRVLASLPGLAGRLPNPAQHQLARALAHDVRRWRSTARVQLGYVAPMVDLGWACPHCGQMSLVTRSDATGAVVCTTSVLVSDVISHREHDLGCTDPAGAPARWDRATWVLLLAQATAQQHLDRQGVA